MQQKRNGQIPMRSSLSPVPHLDHCGPSFSDVGAVSAAHPLAAQAAVDVLTSGGTAADAAIAAQAVVCVVMPHATGLGGDLLALVHRDGAVQAINGTGRSPAVAPKNWASDGGGSVTVPGIVPGWIKLHSLHGRLGLAEVLASARKIAQEGYLIDDSLSAAVDAQRPRLMRYGGRSWNLLGLAKGDLWRQPALASFLEHISISGDQGYYVRNASALMAKAARAFGGSLQAADFRNHSTFVGEPLHTSWGDQTLWVQPPSAQGVLLAMAAKWLTENPRALSPDFQHVLAELTDAVFQYRDEVARGSDNLARHLEVDRVRASNRGGARAYLHTAGVAVADREGMVISSLISVFDDFGSGVFVPELGIVLNNRAAGFTGGDNAPRPNAYPVHTLAPALLTSPKGDVLGLATPGADGQVQTLLQVISRMRFEQTNLAHAIAAPRWRGQDRTLLIEDTHPDIDMLTQRGHRLSLLPSGDDMFGAVVAAGWENHRAYAASDWRRGVVTATAK